MGQAVVLPLIPLRDVVVYPYMVIPLFVGRTRSIRALEWAMATDKQVLLVAQRDATDDEPVQAGLYEVGAVATILQLLKLPDGTVKVLVEGTGRACVHGLSDEGDCLVATVEVVPDSDEGIREGEAMVRALMKQFEQYVSLSKKVPAEVISALQAIDMPGRLADNIATHMPMDLSQKQAVLELHDARERVEHMLAILEGEIDLIQVETHPLACETTDGAQSARVLPQ